MSMDCKLDRSGKPLPVTVCPVCGYRMDAATEATGNGHRPQPQDLTLCVKCGEILIFNEAMVAAVPKVADLMNLPPDVDKVLRRTQFLIRSKRI